MKKLSSADPMSAFVVIGAVFLVIWLTQRQPAFLAVGLVFLAVGAAGRLRGGSGGDGDDGAGSDDGGGDGGGGD